MGCGPLAQFDRADPGILVEPSEEHLVLRGSTLVPSSDASSLLQIIAVNRDEIPLPLGLCCGEPSQELFYLLETVGIEGWDVLPETIGDGEDHEPLAMEDPVEGEVCEAPFLRLVKHLP